MINYVLERNYNFDGGYNEGLYNDFAKAYDKARALLNERKCHYCTIYVYELVKKEWVLKDKLIFN